MRQYGCIRYNNINYVVLTEKVNNNKTQTDIALQTVSIWHTNGCCNCKQHWVIDGNVPWEQSHKPTQRYRPLDDFCSLKPTNLRHPGQLPCCQRGRRSSGWHSRRRAWARWWWRGGLRCGWAWRGVALSPPAARTRSGSGWRGTSPGRSSGFHSSSPGEGKQGKRLLFKTIHLLIPT